MNEFFSVFFDNIYVIVGGILSAIFVAYLLYRNNFKVRQASAASGFRAAFTDAILNLTESEVQTRAIVFNTHGRHLSAINDFRPYIIWWQHFGFNCAVSKYKNQADCYNNMGPLAGFASEQTEEAQARRKELLNSIHKLLSYAKQT